MTTTTLNPLICPPNPYLSFFPNSFLHPTIFSATTPILPCLRTSSYPYHSPHHQCSTTPTLFSSSPNPTTALSEHCRTPTPTLEAEHTPLVFVLDVWGRTLLGGDQMYVETLSPFGDPVTFLRPHLFHSPSLSFSLSLSLTLSLIPSQIFTWTQFPFLLHYDPLSFSYSFFSLVRQSFSDVQGWTSLGGGQMWQC